MIDLRTWPHENVRAPGILDHGVDIRLDSLDSDMLSALSTTTYTKGLDDPLE